MRCAASSPHSAATSSPCAAPVMGASSSPQICRPALTAPSPSTTSDPDEGNSGRRAFGRGRELAARDCFAHVGMLIQERLTALARDLGDVNAILQQLRLTAEARVALDVERLVHDVFFALAGRRKIGESLFDVHMARRAGT